MKHVAVMNHRWYTDIGATVSYTHHKLQCLSQSNHTLQRDTEVSTPARERTMTQDKYSNRIITSGKEMSLHISSESHGSLEGWGSNSRVSIHDYSSLVAELNTSLLLGITLNTMVHLHCSISL